MFFFFFFFNDTATTEIYTLSLHDALPICLPHARRSNKKKTSDRTAAPRKAAPIFPDRLRDRLDCFILANDALMKDRKSTRLNSSHQIISYAVFCLKKKNTKTAVYSQYPHR